MKHIHIGIAAVGLGLVLATSGTALAEAEEKGPTTTHTVVSIAHPADYTRADSKNPEFRGSGAPGACGVVGDAEGTVLCAAKVTGSGWSCTSVVDMGDGATSVTATQNAWGEMTSDVATFEVANQERPFIQNWMILAAVSIVLVIVSGISLTIARTRKRRKDAAELAASGGAPTQAAGARKGADSPIEHAVGRG